MRIVKESPRLRPHANGGLPHGGSHFAAFRKVHSERKQQWESPTRVDLVVSLAAAAMLGMVGGSLATMGTANAAVMVSGSTIDTSRQLRRRTLVQV